MTDWLADNPEIRAIRVAAPDLNGQPRGKRLPSYNVNKVFKNGLRSPFSALNLDIWGQDIEDSPLVFASGDRDAILRPTERGFVPMTWLPNPSALLPVWTFHDDGSPFDGDPRHALRVVLERFQEKGLTPVCAVELEFYLLDDSGPELSPPLSPRSGHRRTAAETLSLHALDRFDDFFTELYASCETMNIPADAAISESGPGQFEINLQHGTNPLQQADDAWLFKMLVKGLARKHKMAASFMAKPYADQSGSGLHMHFSIADKTGRNIFDNGGPEGSDALQFAVSGCLEALSDQTLIFAPHANSYERMVPNAHAPTGICWAYENRTAALRIPGGDPEARRIEHRVAGGDVNPYLMMAAVLGAALNGLEDQKRPPPPLTGDAYSQELPQVTDNWQEAIDVFETSPRVARIFAPELIRNFVLTKRQELRYMLGQPHAEQVATYLETV